jgi:G3E family GTPase
MKTRVILVGGFLGAGKTTLLFESARELTEKGKRVGLITNDQASELVDTAFLEYSKGSIREVSGSCFCCNFNGFIDAITFLTDKQQAEIIIAEPVGSCTDLSATILQPLKEKYANNLIIAPLTVLLDPERLSEILNIEKSELHTSAAYIIRKQLEEADIIVINKTDLLTYETLEKLKKRVAEEWPAATIQTMSVKNKEGLDTWLEVVTKRINAGTHIAEVDYDTYAEGEAVLGWLNATFMLQGTFVDWNSLAEKLLNSLSVRFDELKSPVGHVKLIIEAGDSYVIGNLTGKKESLYIRSKAETGNEAKMIINARVQMEPENLERIVLEEIRVACGKDIISRIDALKCLSPGRPDPTYRYDYIV